MHIAPFLRSIIYGDIDRNIRQRHRNYVIILMFTIIITLIAIIFGLSSTTESFAECQKEHEFNCRRNETTDQLICEENVSIDQEALNICKNGVIWVIWVIFYYRIAAL